MPDLIPSSLRSDPDFRKDFGLLLAMPVGALTDLVETVAGHPMAEIGDLGVEEEDPRRAAYLLTYLAPRIGHHPHPKTELMAFAEEMGAPEDFDVRWPVLERLLGAGTPFQREMEARLAFHLEPGFDKVSFEVMLRPRHTNTAELAGGFHWTIQYHNPAGSPQVLALLLAKGDVEDLITEAQAALDALDETMAMLASTPPVVQD